MKPRVKASDFGRSLARFYENDLPFAHFRAVRRGSMLLQLNVKFDLFVSAGIRQDGGEDRTDTDERK